METLLSDPRVPWGVSIFLGVLILFKEPLSAAIKEFARSIGKMKSRDQEHAQELQEAKLDAALQDRVADRMSQSWLQEQVLELLKENLEFMREGINRDLRDQDKKLDKVIDEVRVVSGQLGMNSAALRRIIYYIAPKSDDELLIAEQDYDRQTDNGQERGKTG